MLPEETVPEVAMVTVVTPFFLSRFISEEDILLINLGIIQNLHDTLPN